MPNGSQWMGVRVIFSHVGTTSASPTKMPSKNPSARAASGTSWSLKESITHANTRRGASLRNCGLSTTERWSGCGATMKTSSRKPGVGTRRMRCAQAPGPRSPSEVTSLASNDSASSRAMTETEPQP